MSPVDHSVYEIGRLGLLQFGDRGTLRQLGLLSVDCNVQGHPPPTKLTISILSPEVNSLSSNILCGTMSRLISTATRPPLNPSDLSMAATVVPSWNCFFIPLTVTSIIFFTHFAEMPRGHIACRMVCYVSGILSIYPSCRKYLHNFHCILMQILRHIYKHKYQ